MDVRDASPIASTGAVTVADLLSRYAPAAPPAARVDLEPPTVPVSVDSLLRREGRIPHAVAPAVGYDVDDVEDAPEARTGRGGILIRRSAIAAGALLAVGALFGAAVVDDVSARSDGTRTQGDLPGQTRLDGTPVTAGTLPTLVGPAAQSDALDAGVDGSSSWMTTAFPSDAPAPAAVEGPGSSVAPRSPAAPLPTDGGGPVTGETDRPETSAPRGDTGQGRDTGSAPGGGSRTGEQDDGGDGLGGAVQDLGEDVGAPVGGPVSAVGGAVDGAGDTVSGSSESDDDGPVRTVADLAGSLL